MTLESFEQHHQQVEHATTFTPSRAAAMTVFAVALVADLFLLSLVWTHVFDELPAGVQGFFLIIMLGSFLGGVMSWKADKIAERFETNLPVVLEAAIAAVASKQTKSCACYAEMGEVCLELADAVVKLSTQSAGFPTQVGRDIADLASAVATLRKDHDELSEETGRRKNGSVTPLRQAPINGS